MHLSNLDENDSDTGSNHETDEDDGSDFHFHDDSLYSSQQAVKPITNNSPGAQKLRSWLNKTLRIKMTDGRTLIGVFLCTDRDANVILGSCSEYLPLDTAGSNEDPRMLGLVMIPGKHIVSVHMEVHIDDNVDRGVSKSGSAEALNYV